MNTSKLWAHDPAALDGLSDLLGHVTKAGSLTFRQRAILVAACASALGDSYCSLAWGKKLADAAGADVAKGVLRGDDAALDRTERALAHWARQLARDPNSTTAADVQSLPRRRLRRRTRSWPSPCSWRSASPSPPSTTRSAPNPINNWVSRRLRQSVTP